MARIGVALAVIWFRLAGAFDRIPGFTEAFEELVTEGKHHDHATTNGWNSY